MYTTITKLHKDFKNLIKSENDTDFINTFKNYDEIILVNYDWEYKYKKFKDYYIRYSYYENKLSSIDYFNYSGEKHREDGPAMIEYFNNGKIFNKRYYLNNRLHRENGPAHISYNNGKIRIKSYYLNDQEFSYKKYIKKLKCIQQ